MLEANPAIHRSDPEMIAHTRNNYTLSFNVHSKKEIAKAKLRRIIEYYSVPLCGVHCML